MKRKWLVLSAIAAIAMGGMFVLENIATAHQGVQNKRQSHNDKSRATRGRIATVNPVTTLNNSWMI